MDELDVVLAGLGRMAGGQDGTVIRGGQFGEGIEQLFELVGAVRIDFAPEHGLNGINIDEAWLIGLEHRFQMRHIGEGKGMQFPAPSCHSLKALILVLSAPACSSRGLTVSSRSSSVAIKTTTPGAPVPRVSLPAWSGRG